MTTASLHDFHTIDFRLATHALTRLPIVEVWGDGMLVGVIYRQTHGLRFMTKHALEVNVESDPPLAIVNLSYRSKEDQ